MSAATSYNLPVFYFQIRYNFMIKKGNKYKLKLQTNYCYYVKFYLFIFFVKFGSLLFCVEFLKVV